LDPAALAELRAGLALDFAAGTRHPLAELCRDLVPDLGQMPVKCLPDKPNLPPPDEWAGRISTFRVSPDCGNIMFTMRYRRDKE
jgi:hypothetical protein